MHCKKKLIDTVVIPTVCDSIRHTYSNIQRPKAKTINNSTYSTCTVHHCASLWTHDIWMVSLNRGISKLRPVAQSAHWRRKRWHQGLRDKNSLRRKCLKISCRELWTIWTFEPNTHVSHPSAMSGTCSSPFDTPHDSRKFNSCELPGWESGLEKKHVTKWQSIESIDNNPCTQVIHMHILYPDDCNDN